MAMEPESLPAREPWWTPFRRPWTWVVILGFALVNVVLQDLGVPEPWGVLAFATLLALSMAVITRSKLPWAPLTVFVAVLVTHAVLRLGGMTAFLVLEGALLVVAILLWRRRRPVAQ